MCKKLCVFAGTTEGRELIELLEGESVSVTACVATEYGGSLLTPWEGLTVSHERLTEEEMEKLFRREQFHLVVDATHPYAAAVTENIAAACEGTGTEYLRLLRSAGDVPEGAVCVPDIQGAVDYLADTRQQGAGEVYGPAGLRRAGLRPGAAHGGVPALLPGGGACPGPCHRHAGALLP